MRLKQLERERLERAARYKGMTLSSLARSALLDAVREVERDMVMHQRAQGMPVGTEFHPITGHSPQESV